MSKVNEMKTFGVKQLILSVYFYSFNQGLFVGLTWTAFRISNRSKSFNIWKLSLIFIKFFLTTKKVLKISCELLKNLLMKAFLAKWERVSENREITFFTEKYLFYVQLAVHLCLVTDN